MTSLDELSLGTSPLMLSQNEQKIDKMGLSRIRREKSQMQANSFAREKFSPSPLQNFVAENGERKLTCAVTVTRTRVDPIMKMDTNIDPKFSFLRNDGWKLVLTLSNNFLRLTFFAAFIPVTLTMTPPWKTCK